MNPFQTPSYLQFDTSKLKKTPQMSVAPKRSSLPQSQIGDTKATSQARFQATQPTTPAPTAQVAKTNQPSKSQGTTKSSGKTSEQKYQEDVRKQIENAYKQQVNFLTAQEQSLQAQLPDYLTTISRPFEAQEPMLAQQLAEQEMRGANEQENLRMQEQQALAQTRRTGEEAGLRAVQQFGGVGGSSAGQAASEIIAREQLRQQGAITQQRASGIQDINNQLRAIQGEYNANLSQLRLQKEQALSQARLNFQQQLDAIKKEKMTAGVTKSQMTIDALGQFAARRQQIEDQIRTQETNLNLLREQAALNAQNLRLQTSLTGTAEITPLPFNAGQFFQTSGPNQSNELAKVLQAGIAAGTIRPFGQSPTGEDLFIDRENRVVDIRGNLYQ
jgi:hypothetical protein